MNVKKIIFLSFYLFCAAKSFSQHKLFEGGSDFQYGFARIEGDASDDSSRPMKQILQYYIDTTGNIVFNDIVKGGFLDKAQWGETDTDSHFLPQNYYMIVSKNGKLGALTSDGKWLLQPMYDSIDTHYAREWTVTMDNKKSLFTRKGFLLPFRFEQAWNMDGDYFNVMLNGKWGVYCKSKDSVVVPCMYDDMDYCYGCEVKGNYFFAEKNGNWGVVDFKNNILLPFEYDHEHWNMTSGDMIYCLSQNGHQLAINLKTKQVDTCNCSPDEEEDTTVVAHGFKRIKKDDKYGLLNPEGKLVLDYTYDYIRYDADSSGIYLPDPYLQISKNNYCGVADTSGKILLPLKYNSISFLKNGFFICQTGTQDNNYREMLMDKNGKQVLSDSYDDITLKYTDCNCDSSGMPYLFLKKNHQYGIYNPASKALAPPQFDDIDEYNFNINYPQSIVFKKDNKEGILDVVSGKTIMPPIYHSIDNDHLEDGLMTVSNSEKYGLYNYRKKQLIVPLEYRYIGVTENHRLLKVSKGSHYALMDFEGKILTPEKYFEIHSLDSSLYVLTMQDSDYHQSYSFYNSLNKQVFMAPFDTIQAVYEDSLAVVTDKGKFKLWNPMTKKIVTGAYSKDGFPDNIDYFMGNSSIFFKNNKAGLMDKSGNVLIQPVYSGMSDFHHGYAIVLETDSTKENENADDVVIADSAQITAEPVSGSPGSVHYGIIDSTGKTVVPIKYDFDRQKDVTDYFIDSCFLLIKNTEDYSQLVGLADLDGKEIIPPMYDKILPQKNGNYYIVEKDKKFGVSDKSGNMMLPVIFDNIALTESPLYDTKYKFNFPLLAEKDGIWQYYKRDGKPLPLKVKKNIPFDNAVFGY